jgi:predicted RNase H-like nuclease
MQFIGVDLAWTERGHTGLCLVEEGRVMCSTLIQTDEEVLGWVSSHAREHCLIAIDAPLIVRNEQGRRGCERILSRCFARHHAAPHSSNLGLPSFRTGVRGARLGVSLILSLDAWFPPRTPVRGAIEVYPHPALVALFNLATTLKYMYFLTIPK